MRFYKIFWKYGVIFIKKYKLSNNYFKKSTNSIKNQQKITKFSEL